MIARPQDLIRNSAVPLEKQPRIIELFAKKIQLPDDIGSLISADDTGIVATDFRKYKRDEWEDVGEYERIFDPGIPIPAIITQITGIDDAMVKNQDRIEKHWPEIQEFFTGAEYCVAHNLSFDKRIMELEQQRFNPEQKFPFPKGICTIESTMHLKGYRLNLQALHVELFGLGFKKAHRARNDVEAMERCFKFLWEKGDV